MSRTIEQLTKIVDDILIDTVDKGCDGDIRFNVADDEEKDINLVFQLLHLHQI